MFRPKYEAVENDENASSFPINFNAWMIEVNTHIKQWLDGKYQSHAAHIKAGNGDLGHVLCKIVFSVF